MFHDMAISSNSFCVMPWVNLATETDGRCKLCCLVMTEKYIKKDDGGDFRLQKDSIEEIYNSAYMRDVRTKMLRGETVPDCAYCDIQERQGGKDYPSSRRVYNQQWLDKGLKKQILESEKNQGHVKSLPISLEPRPGTLCNLACGSCWSLSSSKVHKERRDLLADTSEPTPEFLRGLWERETKLASEGDFSWSESPRYLENFRKCSPGLKRIYFTGGEPTLIKSNIQMLKEMKANGNTDLLVSFTTNLTYLNEDLLELLPSFKRVEIWGSIDGFSSANEYIRYPSKWPDVVENLYKLVHLGGNIGIALSSVLQIGNIFSLMDLIRWLNSDPALHPIHLWPTLLRDPAYLRMDILPDPIRQEALEELNELMNDRNLRPSLQSALEKIRHFLLSPPDESSEKNLEEFRRYTRYIDKKRGTDFTAVFPRMASLLL